MISKTTVSPKDRKRDGHIGTGTTRAWCDFACEGGSGAEKAFGKLKAALGIETFEAELILIDPKTKPSDENERKLRKFCSELTEDGCSEHTR